MEHRNPLHVLGEFSWKDYTIFKAHLRLPTPYLKIIFRNYKNLHEALLAMPTLVDKYNNYLWEKIKMNAETLTKLYKMCNLPVQYYDTQVYITEKPKDNDDLVYLSNNLIRLGGKVPVLYFHSQFADGAMKAATMFMRKAIASKFRSYCVLYPTALEAIKQWDAEDALVVRMASVEFLMIWGIGVEYTTEFTTVQLNSLLQQRKSKGLVTILVSSLDPKEYKSRYGEEPDGIIVGFKDEKVKQTLSSVRNMLEND